VFAARYELNSYIVFRKRLVSKRLMHELRSVKVDSCTLDPVLHGQLQVRD
jgi:hypothetical protein